MSDVINERVDDHEDGHAGEELHVGRSGAYHKPRLRRLGAWNVFTRVGSFADGENTDEGFFQFEVR